VVVEAAAAVRYPLARVSYGESEIAAVIDTLRAGQTTCGPRVAEFERRFAQYVGREHAVMVNSGSSADLLVAFGLGPAQPGDEILVPAVTWPTQVWSCVMAGYTVRLVDVDSETLQFHPVDFMEKLFPQTRALFPVHVLGNVGHMEVLLKAQEMAGIPIIEDCCEALGSTWNDQHVGTFGQAAAFSFFFSHLINTMEGGMVVCGEDDREYRLWRAHGWEPCQDYRFWFPTWGLNVRPTELQGAFGCVQMDSIEEFRAARTWNYRRLAEYTASEFLRNITVFPECQPSWHGFPMMVIDNAPFTRDQLCRHLEAHGIETRPIIAGNLARQPAVRDDPRIITGPLPGAAAVHDHGFYMGLANFDDPDGTAYVGEVVADFMRTL
jgi:dTDP-4-amino-4,6-dideoxygalactose transaminase